MQKAFWPPELKRLLPIAIGKCAYLRRLAKSEAQTNSLVKLQALCTRLIECWDPRLVAEVPESDLAPWHGETAFPVHLESGGSVLEVRRNSRRMLADLNELLLWGHAWPDKAQFNLESPIFVLQWNEEMRQNGIVVAVAAVNELALKHAEARVQALSGQCSSIVIVGIGGVLLTDRQWTLDHWREICTCGEQAVSIFPIDSAWLVTLFEDGDVSIGIRQSPWRHQIVLPPSRS